MLPNKFDSPLPEDCALAAPDISMAAATTARAARAFINSSIISFLSHPVPSNSGFQEAPSRFPIV
jgi:hypothetical protein